MSILAPTGRQGAARPGRLIVLRDACEIALVRAAFARDLPVLATCRGTQVLNVAFGGTLHQDLPGSDGVQHRRREGEFTRHPVLLSAGSLAARVAGGERHVVDSHHHQAVDRVASNFRVSGRATDGLIEAIEDPSRASRSACSGARKSMRRAA